jgi:hypothetical protein
VLLTIDHAEPFHCTAKVAGEGAEGSLEFPTAVQVV